MPSDKQPYPGPTAKMYFNNHEISQEIYIYSKIDLLHDIPQVDISTDTGDDDLIVQSVISYVDSDPH